MYDHKGYKMTISHAHSSRKGYWTIWDFTRASRKTARLLTFLLFSNLGRFKELSISVYSLSHVLKHLTGKSLHALYGP